MIGVPYSWWFETQVSKGNVLIKCLSSGVVNNQKSMFLGYSLQEIINFIT